MTPDLTQNIQAQFFCSPKRALLAECVLLVATLLALVEAHVFHQAKAGHRELIEHGHSPSSIQQSDVLQQSLVLYSGQMKCTVFNLSAMSMTF